MTTHLRHDEFSDGDHHLDRDELATRAARHHALGDPIRLAIVDELARSDRAPVELARRLAIPSNLLAHHLDVLEQVGLIGRSRSSGDGRRRYAHLQPAAVVVHGVGAVVPVGPALFVCHANAARSPLAAALWRRLTGHEAESAGTHPAERVHPGTVAAAGRAGLDLGHAAPRHVDELREWQRRRRALVVTVCDRSHEELPDGGTRLHWSTQDPLPTGRRSDFDRALRQLADRISTTCDVRSVA